MSKISLLLVEDEPDLRNMLKNFFSAQRIHCLQARNITTAKQIIDRQAVDVIILDWMLPDGNGGELLRFLKSLPHMRDTPIIVLTARAEEENKLLAFDLGCDDYVDKPFSPHELEKRIHAVLRRAKPFREPTYRLGSLLLDPAEQFVEMAGKRTHLGKTETGLLRCFAEHPDKVLDRSWLLAAVWTGKEDVSERTVDVYVMRLRKLLRQQHQLPAKLIETVWGSGYRLNLSALKDG